MGNIPPYVVPGACVLRGNSKLHKAALYTSSLLGAATCLYLLCCLQFAHAGWLDGVKSYGESVVDDVVNTNKQEADAKVRETVIESVNDAKHKTKGAVSGQEKHDPKLVSDIQTELNRLGYNAGNVDGVFSADTSSAIQRFQRDQGMAADGVPTNAVLGKLKSQSSGTDVVPSRYQAPLR